MAGRGVSTSGELNSFFGAADVDGVMKLRQVSHYPLQLVGGHVYHRTIADVLGGGEGRQNTNRCYTSKSL